MLLLDTRRHLLFLINPSPSASFLLEDLVWTFALNSCHWNLISRSEQWRPVYSEFGDVGVYLHDLPAWLEVSCFVSGLARSLAAAIHQKTAVPGSFRRNASAWNCRVWCTKHKEFQKKFLGRCSGMCKIGNYINPMCLVFWEVLINLGSPEFLSWRDYLVLILSVVKIDF